MDAKDWLEQSRRLREEAQHVRRESQDGREKVRAQVVESRKELAKVRERSGSGAKAAGRPTRR